MNRDIQKDMNTLRPLLAQLRAGEIQAIEFGNPNSPGGFMSHHRIKVISTPAGSQICFKLLSRGMEGSGDYMGNADDREIEIKAQSHLDHYFQPTPFSKLLAEMNKKLPSDSLTYFGVKDLS
ncbi:hypothetical protein [Acinetobacter sp.]|uniref:hypothetical protein n=1 Tax=Acinetobacter sp. TaxID=472 RepID=UPI00388DEDBC